MQKSSTEIAERRPLRVLRALAEIEDEPRPATSPGPKIPSRPISRNHTHTHTHFRVAVGKAENHAENEGWPEGLLACNWMKIKNELRPARRTCS